MVNGMRRVKEGGKLCDDFFYLLRSYFVHTSNIIRNIYSYNGISHLILLYKAYFKIKTFKKWPNLKSNMSWYLIDIILLTNFSIFVRANNTPFIYYRMLVVHFSIKLPEHTYSTEGRWAVPSLRTRWVRNPKKSLHQSNNLARVAKLIVVPAVQNNFVTVYSS